MDKITSTHPTDGQEPNAGSPGQEPNSSGQEPNETSKPPLSREALEAIIADLRAKDAEKRIKIKEFEEAQRKQQEAEQAKEQERMKEQGKWQELAEQSSTRVKELEPVQEKYTQLSSLVSEQIESQIKDWPADAKLFDPGKDAPIESRLEWMNKARKLAEKLQAKNAQPGNGPNPKPASGSGQQTEQQMHDKLRATGIYGRF